MDLQRRRQQLAILHFDNGVCRRHENAEMMHHGGPLCCLVEDPSVIGAGCTQILFAGERLKADHRPHHAERLGNVG